MPEPDLPSADDDAEEMSVALRKAAERPRDHTDDKEIAADDAGGGTLAEED